MQSENEQIRAYLVRLEQAAAGWAGGLDAALVHDMLIDAGEHLRGAVESGATAGAAIEEFGEPAEVIAAYVAADTGRARPARAETDVLARWSRWPVVGVWFDRYAWGALLFFLLGIIPATVYFTFAVTGLSLVIGTLPLILGLPLLVLVLGMARGLCLAEGAIVQAMLGIRMPRRMQPLGTKGGFWQRIWLWLKDVRSWLSLAFLIGNFPVAAFLFSVFVTLVSAALSLIALPVMQWVWGTVSFGNGHVRILGWHLRPDPVTGNTVMPAGLVVLLLVLGPVLLTGTLWLAKGTGWIYGQVVKAIQVTRPAPSSGFSYVPPAGAVAVSV